MAEYLTQMEIRMAGTQGQAGKMIKAPMSTPLTSGKPEGKGAPSGTGSFKGVKGPMTNVKSKGPK